MLGERKAECPSCGAPIVWQLASSQAVVCKYCQFAVVRSDRELSAIGRVADLVPSAAPLAVGDEGIAAGRSFRVLGRLQLDHGRGPWDEWYLGFSDGGWGWLARAEGRWYVTFERHAEARWEQVAPGARLTLIGVPWVVTERGRSTLVSAEGELPYPFSLQATSGYADLEGPEGAFATLDFAEAQRFFAGRELSASDVVLKREALGPRPTEKVAVRKLSCPSCGAPIAIFVPAECERVGCAHCGALLAHQQAHAGLELLQQLDPPPVMPQLPLGSTGTLLGEPRTVIGFMQRYVMVDGDRYTFREYLLYGVSGYSWLVEENAHWLYVAPIATSSVVVEPRAAYYRERRYSAFARGEPVVDFVIGEFTWKVMVGDRSTTFDYIDPPRLVSSEQTDTEISWSEGEYVEPATLVEAFGLAGLPTPSGVAPAQPNPHRTGPAARTFALLALLWFLLAFAYERGHEQRYSYDGLQLAGGDLSSSQGNVVLTEPFLVPRGPTTLAVYATGPIKNGAAYIEASLIPEDPPGEPRVLPITVAYYQGYEDGQRWSEGGPTNTEYFGGVPAGRYSMRFVGEWDPYEGGVPAQPDTPPVQLTVTVGKRSHACSLVTLLLLVAPWLLTLWRSAYFESRRKLHESLP